MVHTVELCRTTWELRVINYPAVEKTSRDSVVTRISNTLGEAGNAVVVDLVSHSFIGLYALP